MCGFSPPPRVFFPPWSTHEVGDMADPTICRMAPVVYHAEGKRIAERLWNETMEELEFAHAAEIVEGLKSV